MASAVLQNESMLIHFQVTDQKYVRLLAFLLAKFVLIYRWQREL